MCWAGSDESLSDLDGKQLLPTGAGQWFENDLASAWGVASSCQSYDTSRNDSAYFSSLDENLPPFYCPLELCFEDCEVPFAGPLSDTLTTKHSGTWADAVLEYKSETTIPQLMDSDFSLTLPSPLPLITQEEDNIQLNLEVKATKARRSWVKGSRCTWEGCSSTAQYKTDKLFETHIRNIHIKPLVCPFFSCPHKAPFRGNHDLKRHMAVHQKKEFRCPYAHCGGASRTGKAYSRRDKLMSHLRTHHYTELCPFNHCDYDPMRDSERSISKHICGKSHNHLECGLRSCSAKTSRFSDAALFEHLVNDHRMDKDVVIKACTAVRRAGEDTVTAKHIPKVVIIGDCQSCGDAFPLTAQIR